MAPAMASDATNADTTELYRLSCRDCAFEEHFEGDLDGALEVANGHQAGAGITKADHFVNLEVQID